MRGGLFLLTWAGFAVQIADQSSHGNLAIDVLAGGGAFLGAIAVTPGMMLCPEMKWLAERAGPLLPVALQPFIDRACTLEGALA
jgi:hypothetical protein